MVTVGLVETEERTTYTSWSNYCTTRPGQIHFDQSQVVPVVFLSNHTTTSRRESFSPMTVSYLCRHLPSIAKTLHTGKKQPLHDHVNARIAYLRELADTRSHCPSRLLAGTKRLTSHSSLKLSRVFTVATRFRRYEAVRHCRSGWRSKVRPQLCYQQHSHVPKLS